MADAGHTPTVRRTFEDSPFYARATPDTHLFGTPALAVHETLSIDRFAQPRVKGMLPSGCRARSPEARRIARLSAFKSRICHAQKPAVSPGTPSTSISPKLFTSFPAHRPRRRAG